MNYKPNCDCGAKHTSFPNKHYDWCKVEIYNKCSESSKIKWKKMTDAPIYSDEEYKTYLEDTRQAINRLYRTPVKQVEIPVEIKECIRKTYSVGRFSTNEPIYCKGPTKWEMAPQMIQDGILYRLKTEKKKVD